LSPLAAVALGGQEEGHEEGEEGYMKLTVNALDQEVADQLWKTGLVNVARKGYTACYSLEFSDKGDT
jgi:hypothetical protein